MNRRRFLQAAGVTTLVTAIGGAPRALRAGTMLVPGTVPLRFPPNLGAASLLAREVNVEVWPGERMNVLAYGDVYPGPTVHLRNGERFRLTLTNGLTEDTTIHWHGLTVPPHADGQPTEAVAPGEDYVYEFDVRNNAGTYFYHPHPHGRTAYQVYGGMSGLVLVTDSESEALSMPRAYFDMPLLIQDRLSAESHQFTYEPTRNQILNGFLGDTILVNGTPDAVALVDAGSYRMRLVNGSNARILKLGFSDGRRFHVIANDAGLLAAPAPATSVFLGPGERVEIVVNLFDIAEGSSTTLQTLQFGSAATPAQQGYPMPVLTLVATGMEGYQWTVPQKLVTVPRFDPAAAVRTRRFELQTMPAPMDGHFHRINGLHFEMGRVDFRVPFRELEIWEFVNMHSMPHPIHIHGAAFQVLDRTATGTTLAPEEQGWKDTVMVWGGETVRIMIRFDEYEGRYVMHCHNLEHEDEGMMLTFEVETTTSVDQERLPEWMDLR